ncbi:MAG: hypothetical protein AAF732_09200 [Pseudomonadota bacterium]
MSYSPDRHSAVSRDAGWILQIRRVALLLLASATWLSVVWTNDAIAAPPIRLIPGNEVPTCVTPERLMVFLRSRNPRLNRRFRRIAHWYAHHGERWRVRWDYAFYQMALETNFLTYRRPNGKWGDVNPRQNNFAGLGTTGGGVPGDSYPDVSTGVLAQLQHLIVYSGERLAKPVGHRTRLKQDVILSLSKPVAARRPVTFQDLSGRWAVDRRYGRSIEAVASLFRKRFCGGRADRHLARRRPPEPRQSTRRQQRSSERTVAATAWRTRTSERRSKPQCTVSIASYGGTRTLLIESFKGRQRNLTALEVDPRRSDEMAASFIARYAVGGETIGTFRNQRAALARAFRICPAAAEPRGRG